jgi:GGDEF domain-containing protein
VKYWTFEILVGFFGAFAVLGTLIAGIWAGASDQELIAQFMLLPILLAAIHYERKGGLIAALAATLIYVGLRVPQLLDPVLRQPVLGLLIVRTAAYVVIGVMGGEVCALIKHFFQRVEQRDLIDPETGIYAPGHIGRLLSELIEENGRYGTLFSAALFDVDPAAVPAERRHRKHLLREIAHAIHNDVRAVDDVGRRSEYEFLALFPNTPLEGGNVASGRVSRSIQTHLDKRGVTAERSFSTRTLGYPEDSEELTRLAEVLTGEQAGAPETPDPVPEEA